MEDYAVFTLNISRIGENLKDELDDKIASIDFNFKRSLQMSPVEAPVAMITAPPSTLIKVRAPKNPWDEATQGIDSVVNSANSEAESVGSEVKSKATSVESVAKSKITGALSAAQSEVIKLVNEAYEGIIDGLNLEDFYSLHMITTCSGHYVTSDGKNITVGGTVMADNSTHKHVDKCEKHSALDPVQLVRIVYEIGIAFVGLALFTAIVGVFKGHRGLALINIVVTGAAFAIIGLATAVTHGVAVGAEKLINFVGQDLGVEGQVGLWKNLSWGCVGLLGFNMLFLWPVIGWLRHRAEKGALK